MKELDPKYLKIPKRKPSVRDQVGRSRFSYTPSGKYTDRIKGINIDTTYTPPIPKLDPGQITENQENDYIENTYIDDYFE
jgi:hypothetical protein